VSSSQSSRGQGLRKRCIYIEDELQRSLRQAEVDWRFEAALIESVGVPFKMQRQDVYLRSENDFGVLSTNTVEAILIDFGLR
jgi:hypothetical protein